MVLPAYLENFERDGWQRAQGLARSFALGRRLGEDVNDQIGAQPWRNLFAVRMDQQHRAVGTIVVGQEPVAVENHLFVLTPNDGSLARCQELISALQSPRATQWFDQRIRCRHLTAATLRQFPWWEDER